jgi:flagellar basal-body rod protein FlgG
MSTFAMHVAKTGLNSQQVKMQVIANNLANVNTTGFKSDRANFESLLYQILRGAGENTSENTSLTSGLSVGTWHKVAEHQQAVHARQPNRYRQFA